MSNDVLIAAFFYIIALAGGAIIGLMVGIWYAGRMFGRAFDHAIKAGEVTKEQAAHILGLIE